MKKILFSFIFLCFILLALNPAESVVFPGSLGFEFILRPVMMDSSNGFMYSPVDNNLVVNEIKLENEINSWIDFAFKDFYIITPLIYNIFRFNNKNWFGDDLTIGIKNKFAAARGSNWLDIGFDTYNKITWTAGDKVNLAPKALLFFQGKTELAGFYWKIEESCELFLNPELYKDNDPTKKNIGLYDKAAFYTWTALEFEFFHFFAPDNIKCYLWTEDLFTYTLPYSYGAERQKSFANEVKAGFNFDLAGVKPFIYFWLRTYDYYNTSAPLDGTQGSSVTWLDSDLWSGDNIHNYPSRRIGTRVGIMYTKSWLKFGIEYYGDIEANKDLYDKGGTYSAWNNQLNIWIDIKVGSSELTLSGWQ